MRPESERAELRDLVRRGYDAISNAYRDDSGESNAGSAETTGAYGAWLAELSALLPAGSRVLDLGCGAGVPAARDLVAAGFRVTGVDISAVQVRRARELVPEGTFIQADMATWDPADGSFDAVVCLYALIHVPLEDQRSVIPRIRRWLADPGYEYRTRFGFHRRRIAVQARASLLTPRSPPLVGAHRSAVLVQAEHRARLIGMMC